MPPPGRTAVSTSTSRELLVATFLTDRELAGIRTITVSAAQNGLSVRR
jgi:hypothetical protein